jgi:hypothetical protein
MAVKIQDHSVYRGQTDKQIVARIQKIQKLLKHFGVKVYAFDPGVRCYIEKTTYNMDFDSVEWEWLQSLLRELLGYREYCKKYNMDTKGRKKHENTSKKL